MKYAVVKIKGIQYKVGEGDRVETNRIPLAEGKKLVLRDVFLLVDEGGVKIGKPTVGGVVVNAKAEKQFLGKKLYISKFKAKTGFRRKIGFRPQRTLLKIEEISC